jgi:hypothetical protein
MGTASTPAPGLCSLRSRIAKAITTQWAKTTVLQQQVSAARQMGALAHEGQKYIRWLTLIY